MIIVAGQIYRTGTTFVQRLLNCTDECMIYGENNQLIPSIYNALTYYNHNQKARSDEQWQSFYKDKNTFSANISPHPSYIYDKFANLIKGIYGTPEYYRYGFKQIVFRESDYNVLDALFDNQKRIIYCQRDLESAYASYKQLYDFMPYDLFKQHYEASIPDDFDRPDIYRLNFDNINKQTCEEIIDFVGCSNKDNIDRVLEKRIREVPDYFNIKKQEITNPCIVK